MPEVAQKQLNEDELQQVLEVEKQRQELFTQLGMNRAEQLKLEEFEMQITKSIHTVDREREAFHNRLKRKYDIPLNAKINMNTGVIEE